jgi:hypothetical protein
VALHPAAPADRVQRDHAGADATAFFAERAGGSGQRTLGWRERAAPRSFRAATARQAGYGAGDKPCAERSTCPSRGSEDTVPIVYGLPTRELEEAAGRGELVLGGCLVSFDAADRACENCGHHWQTGVLPGWLKRRFTGG